MAGNWLYCADGTPYFSPGSLGVTVGPVEVWCAPVSNQLLLYTPQQAYKLDLPSGGRGEAYRSRWPFGRAVEGSEWRRSAPGGTWWSGTLLVEPTGVEFIDASELLPLERPSKADIAAAPQASHYDLDESAWFSYLAVVNDIAGSERFMQRVRNDEFARHAFTVMRDNDLIRNADRKRVLFSSERQICHLLAILRRHGEDYADLYMRGFFCDLIPEVEQELIGLLHEVGYSVEPN